MTDFPLSNLPFGVYRAAGGDAHICTAFEDRILDLHACARAGLIDEPALREPLLNGLMAKGRAASRAVRARARELIESGQAEAHFVAMAGAEMLLPMRV